MSDIRIIKKYPNRRLYDTAISQYITLDEVRELVLKHVKFQVIDVRSNEDMTNYVLLQIISEQETQHSPIFTTEILQNIIRFYGNPLQNMMSQFLEKTFSGDFPQYLQDLVEKDPFFNTMSEVTKQNIALWQSAYNQYFNKKPEKKSSKKSKK